MKTKIVERGYTVTVVSWENDGDIYNTRNMVVQEKSEALAIKHMCENLFISNHDDKTIGNKMDYEDTKCYEIVKNYLLDNPFLCEVNENDSAESVWKKVRHYNRDLLGYSEYYFSRVCDSCTITYSPEDIFVELVA